MKTLEERVNTGRFHGLWALTNRELMKWYKAPFLVFLSLIQPVIWLGLFGKAMNFSAIFSSNSFQIPGLDIPKEIVDKFSQSIMQNTFGTTDYFSFLSVGMLSFVIVFTAMFSGMSIVWDRRFGFLDKVLSTPVSRSVIVIGKVLSSVFRSLLQAAIILVVAVLLGMNYSNITPLGVAGTFAGLFLMTFGLSAFFLMLALRSTDWQSQVAIMNLVNLPLLFGSNALFPSKFMPTWLQSFVSINPITYGTDVGRQLLLGSPGYAPLSFDFLYLFVFAVLFASIGIVMSWRFLVK
jgi:ABC-2 type transport system permease protein